MMNRALPGPKIDLIRDGVPLIELKEAGDRAVYNALFRTAASACQRGWDFWEWEVLVLEAKSQLGNQARLKGGRTQRSKSDLRKLFDSVWEAATKWVTEQPKPWDSDATREEAKDRAALLLTVVEDADAPLKESDRNVLIYAAELAVERGMDRVALPWRAVKEGTGLGERTVKNALRRLDHVGLLVLAERGRAGGSRTKERRANLYRLATADGVSAYQYRGTRSVGPAAQVCGTPSEDEHGTPP
jgi:hypothetical protein